jgi:hypothetical protein
MTKYEYFKSMSIENLAKLIKNHLGSKTCKKKYCPYFSETKGYCINYSQQHCIEATINWLNSEKEQEK